MEAAEALGRCRTRGRACQCGHEFRTRDIHRGRQAVRMSRRSERFTACAWCRSSRARPIEPRRLRERLSGPKGKLDWRRVAGCGLGPGSRVITYRDCLRGVKFNSSLIAENYGARRFLDGWRKL